MTNFQDPHIIGAVFGRAIYKYFEFQGVSDKRKISILIDWIESFIQKSDQEQDPKKILEIAAHEFYAVASSATRRNSIRCIKYYSYFAGLTRNRCYQ